MPPSMREKLRYMSNHNLHMIAVNRWLEADEIGITISQLLDEPGLFDDCKRLKKARKRVYSEAFRRWKLIKTIRGDTLRIDERTSAPWTRYSPKYDPRPKLGPQEKPRMGFSALTAQQRTVWAKAIWSDALIKPSPVGITLTVAEQSKTSKP